MNKPIVFLTLMAALLLSSLASAQQAPGPKPPLFKTEAAAKKHCPTDNVVWLDTKNDVFHFKSQRWYGHTKSGGYVCEKEAHRPGVKLPKSK